MNKSRHLKNETEGLGEGLGFFSGFFFSPFLN